MVEQVLKRRCVLALRWAVEDRGAWPGRNKHELPANRLALRWRDPVWVGKPGVRTIARRIQHNSSAGRSFRKPSRQLEAAQPSYCVTKGPEMITRDSVPAEVEKARPLAPHLVR